MADAYELRHGSSGTAASNASTGIRLSSGSRVYHSTRT